MLRIATWSYDTREKEKERERERGANEPALLQSWRVQGCALGHAYAAINSFAHLHRQVTEFTYGHAVLLQLQRGGSDAACGCRRGVPAHVESQRNSEGDGSRLLLEADEWVHCGDGVANRLHRVIFLLLSHK